MIRIALFILSTGQNLCLANVQPTELTFDLSGPISQCFPHSHDHLQPVEVFDGCKEAVEEYLARDSKHPDHGKTVREMATRQGYLFQSYEVHTEDGYILSLFRIPGNFKDTPKPGKPVVFLQHGVMQSSESWFILEGNQGLALKLVNDGFDVFMGNARGTRYSLDHETLDFRQQTEYWDFSWNEFGVYDLPANIAKVLEVSGVDKIYYIGFSTGATQFLVGLSEYPKLNKRIEAAILLSPVAFMGHSDSPVKFAAHKLSQPESKGFFGPLLSGRVGKFGETSKEREYFCPKTAHLCGLCGSPQYFLMGINPEQTNFTNLPNTFSKSDEYVSVCTLLHFTQSINYCKFRKYDYGKNQNMKKYGQSSPPDYKIETITVPTYLFVGAMDKFAYPEDVNITVEHMRPGIVRKQILIPKLAWSHLDFISGIDADKLVNDVVVKILDMHVRNDVDLNEID